LHLEESRFQKTHLFLVKKSTQWVCLIVPFLIAVIPNQHVIFLKHIIVIPCCAVIIYNLAFDKNSILKLDQKQLNYLGKATYSLYVLNQIVIDFSIKICFGIHIKQPIAIFIISITALLICSFICYELIEKPFMKLRRYFN
jgi:peptidoglycan/LPS O-acetylase OafA/YrhL